MRSAALGLTVALACWACGSHGTPAPAATPTPSATPGPAATPQVDGPEGWTLLANSPASPANARHDDLFFMDTANGWLINTRGEVYRTDDGGATWQSLAHFPDGIFPRCVGFASATLGWVGNLNITAGQIRPDSSLWETTDGGRTWSNISTRIGGDTVIGLCGMRVVSRSVAVAVGRWLGPAVFVKTTDGGRTWTSRSLAPLATGVVDLFFFNERDGFVVGGLGDGSTEAEQRASRAVVLATADGGETWQARYTSTAVGQRCWKIQFVTDRVGYVTTEGPTPEGVVLKTTDGGLTWRPMLVDPAVPFEGVAFVSPDRGWVGAFPTLYSTLDGGQTWRRLAFGTRVNRMRVLNESLIYASGDRVYRWTP
jgi:photosystem II stability/assembly factor-like uncharacterized protein